jgi:hypothetical protein
MAAFDVQCAVHVSPASSSSGQYIAAQSAGEPDRKSHRSRHSETPISTISTYGQWNKEGAGHTTADQHLMV